MDVKTRYLIIVRDVRRPGRKIYGKISGTGFVTLSAEAAIEKLPRRNSRTPLENSRQALITDTNSKTK